MGEGGALHPHRPPPTPVGDPDPASKKFVFLSAQNRCGQVFLADSKICVVNASACSERFANGPGTDHKPFEPLRMNRTHWRSRPMTSLTQLCRDLSIGKPRLYGLLERLDIQPEQVGNKRLLDDAQVAKVRDALASKTDRKPTETVQDRPQTDHKPTTQTAIDSDKSELVATLRDQITHLKELLANEQSERQEERQERSNYQQMLMLVQKDVQHLRLENDRLKLLEHTKPEATESIQKEEVYSRPPAEEFKVEDIPPETVANRNSRSGSRAFGVGLSVAAIIGVLFYAAITQGGGWLSGSLERGISAALKVSGTEPDTR